MAVMSSCSTRTFLLDDTASMGDPAPRDDSGVAEPLRDAAPMDTGVGSIDLVHELPPDLKGKTLSYHQHAKAILAARCASCHRSDGYGPFALDTYASARTVSAALREVVADESMPPFLPSTDNCRALSDVRAMPDTERGVLEAWVAQGALEGDATRGSELTVMVPSDRLTSPTASHAVGYLPAPSPSDLPSHRCYVVDPQLASDTAYAGFFVEPSNARSLRRALVHLALPGREVELMALEALDTALGYDCFYGAGLSGAITVSDWVVGQDRFGFPARSAVYVPQGSRFVVELEETAGRGPDSPSLVTYAAESATAEPSSLYVLNTELLVPRAASDASASATGTFVAKSAIPKALGEAREGKVWGVSALMHLRGKSARMELVRSTGERECLLDLPAFDLSWAGGYRLATPLTVVAGDRIELTCRWDNSAQNQPVVNGEQVDSTDLTFGSSVLDETCVGSVLVTL